MGSVFNTQIIFTGPLNKSVDDFVVLYMPECYDVLYSCIKSCFLLAFAALVWILQLLFMKVMGTLMVLYRSLFQIVQLNPTFFFFFLEQQLELGIYCLSLRNRLHNYNAHRRPEKNIHNVQFWQRLSQRNLHHLHNLDIIFPI